MSYDVSGKPKGHGSYTRKDSSKVGAISMAPKESPMSTPNIALLSGILTVAHLTSQDPDSGNAP